MQQIMRYLGIFTPCPSLTLENKMAHISSIGAALFSDLSICMPATDLVAADIAGLTVASEFQQFFTAEIDSQGGTKAGVASTTSGVVTVTGSPTFVRVKSVRSFPAMGTPANIVKVPTYGSKTSSTIQGQADAPQLEIDLNFIPAEWSKESGNLLGNAVGNGVQYLFRFSLLNAEPTATTTAKYASTVGGLGTVQNSQYYWIGKIEALMVTPSLTDASTAKITLSIQSPFYGAFTI